MTRTANTSTTAQRLARAEDLEWHVISLERIAYNLGPKLGLGYRRKAAAFRAEAKALRERGTKEP